MSSTYRDNKMLKVDSQGLSRSSPPYPRRALGICASIKRIGFTSPRLQSHEIYEVMLDGTVKRILGNGERGIVDGADTKARLSFPNGIVRHPWAQRL